MQAATSSAADLLRMPDVGRVGEGALADLVLYREDPLERIETVLEPLMVMRDGEVVSGEVS
jgi:imidazolonepropionase-like amidohydrolase